MNNTSKFTVAICGGGVGGLICAVALSRYENIQVDIYEAAQHFAEIGAGIGMWPRAWKIMKSLGLDRDLGDIAIVPPDNHPKVAFNFRKGDQPEGLSFYTLETPGGMISFHRAEFHNVLLRHLSPSCRTHCRKRLVSYSQPVSSSSYDPHTFLRPPVKLRFQDGTTAHCDLLIGADGVKSAVRMSLVHELSASARAGGRTHDAEDLLRAAEPRWSGMSAYRATIPAETLRMRLPGHRVLTDPMVYFGKNTQMTVYPISRGTIINFAAFRACYDLEHTTFDAPWVQDVPLDELFDDFARWEPEVQALFQCVRKINRWAIHTSAPLPSFVSGRVALLGDAAHAMMPFQGAGAGQAIEDAYVLSTLLGHRRATRATLPRVLQVYDAVRRPFAQRVAESSRENGMLYTLNFPGLTFDAPVYDADAEKLAEIRARIRMNWEWAWRRAWMGTSSARCVCWRAGMNGMGVFGDSILNTWFAAIIRNIDQMWNELLMNSEYRYFTTTTVQNYYEVAVCSPSSDRLTQLL
ncbi:Salicylate hydroxylase [Grifola frondosa]|uniref:Salicylate hydroxylase n=1 Tax=Grifola frondosa TaxID=5627 RepID=A0A1C7MB67_GRIFR|nr:Salicylate hydroxylase [Grifola frondosa]